MVQKLRDYFVLYVITIQLIMRVQENIEVASMSQRPRLTLSIISEDISLVTTVMQQYEKCKTIARGGKKLAF